MEIYKNRLFSAFARKQNIGDDDLCRAITRAERGLVDADLGGGVIKQRIARPNEGKSGGFRTIIFFRVEERAFFIFGFAKNQRDNISVKDLQTFKRAAQVTLNFTSEEIEEAVETGKLIEVICNEDEKNLQE